MIPSTILCSLSLRDLNKRYKLKSISFTCEEEYDIPSDEDILQHVRSIAKEFKVNFIGNPKYTIKVNTLDGAKKVIIDAFAEIKTEQEPQCIIQLHKGGKIEFRILEKNI
ncbi:hypothetical protein A9Q91_02680 [Candidatus Gracilibacteria bacterium 28_42_T64]|nr:hypothetical protein A9Q91_02680 [Candidatus Gracilibacteria bacterium 28_42_T64]